ncbi:MAG: DUF177 domain-containing protein, partial [Immundisolibacteraceae bacterium]|nr:DUF177 domain-containing protein [Immundisolibacteraceae bacterium]
MSTGLPEIIDPISLCKRGAELVGEIPLGSMERLKSTVVNVLGKASVELKFSITDRAEKLITGQVVAVVFAECQRCLQPVELKIKCNVNLQLVKDEAAAAELVNEREPLLFQSESEFQLRELVEDELLLGLPIVALHDETVCQMSASNTESS